MSKGKVTDKDRRQIEALVRDLLKAKARGDRHDVEYLLSLRDISEKHADLIKRAFTKFSRFLSSNGLYDVGRFAAFLAGLEYIDDATAIKIGVPMVLALAKTQNRANVKEAVRLAVDSAKVRGVRPNARLASEFMVQSGARDEVIRGVSKAARLQAQVNQLQAEVQKLRAELRVKNRRIEQLEKAVGSKRRATLASASASVS
jgi:hypothetical protein